MPSSQVDTQAPRGSGAGALVLLLFMPAVAGSVVLGVQLYLGAGVSYPTLLMVASLALFIYAANGLSDGVEDTANDAARAVALRRSALWTLAVATTGLSIAGLLLTRSGKLHAIYALVLLVGIAYSFRIIPHPLGGARPRLRLKDVPLLKNVSIGATWAGAAFLGPVLDLDVSLEAPARVAIVGLGYALMVAVNSLFCDIRDERGDRSAQIQTLPVRFGAARCFRGTFVVMSLWTAFVAGAFAAGVLDLRHVVLLAASALGYPLAVWLVVTKLRPRLAISNAVIESSDVAFALGLIALSA